MLAAMRGRAPAPLVDRTGLLELEVCPRSGDLPGEHCTHRHRELFVPQDARILQIGMGALEDVEVGAANPDLDDVDSNPALVRLGPVNLPAFEFSRLYT
jgi:hypothetical protein